MAIPKITSADILSELEFSFSKSSGPGGQHVNKVNTKVGLRWNIANSGVITEEQKLFLSEKLANKLTKEGVLVLSSQEARSQLINKELVIEKLDKLLQFAFFIKKKRKPTKPTKASKERRLKNKKQQAEKKEGRRKL
ncbi:Hypothetical protein YaeJ with similarity to translation release factor [hydrothermal vent metagenome]|uniref:Prokaryotic-type class I peptide chain release factors domain-containing protein n=1 Tax=hydrothermal vent metagenome TaxID=652676 RepID=A0A3B0UPJ7_9ZZZZ